MTPAYPPLPTIEPRRADEPVFYFGGRVLRFVLEHATTATLTDDELHAALHTSIAAVTLPPLDPDAPTLPAVHDRIADAKRLIGAALAGRAKDAQAAQDAAQASGTSQPPKGAPGTSVVPLAPLPKVNPPAGTYGVPMPRPPQKAEVTF